jgi:hypothetical protein
MLIRYLDGKTVHVENPMGRALIAAKLAVEMRVGALGQFVTVEEFENQKATVRHETAWRVVPGSRVEDFQYPPRIFYSCTCGQKGYTKPLVSTYNGGEKLRPGANKELVRFMLRHSDGSVESIPDHILKEFNRLDGQHSAKKKAKGARQVNALDISTAGTDDFRRFGLKPREVLLAEARNAAKKFPSGGKG